MPSRMCSICKRLHWADTEEWKFVSYSSEFVCSIECVLAWVGKRKYDKTAEWTKRAVPLRVTDKYPQFRSGYELDISRWLDSKKVQWFFERVGFTVGETKTYTPDFYLPKHGSFLEVKGKWGIGQKSKLKEFRAEYKDVPLLVVPWLLHVSVGG